MDRPPQPTRLGTDVVPLNRAEVLAKVLAEPLCAAICDLLGEARVLVSGEVGALLTRVIQDSSVTAALDAALAAQEGERAAVAALHYPVPDPENRLGVFWCSCAGGIEGHPYYEYDDCPTRAALADPAGALATHDAEVAAKALRVVADDYSVNLTALTGPIIRDWLRERADRIEAQS